MLRLFVTVFILSLGAVHVRASDELSKHAYEIVFGSFRNGDFASSLFAISVDGSRERQICEHESGRPTCLDPTVAPDFSTILFTRGGSNHRTSVWGLNTELGSESRLTDAVNIRFDGGRATPRLSPGGQRFVYSSNLSGSDHIFVADVDGRHTQQLTGDAGNNTYAAWSPDGELIAFASDRSGSSQVYVMTKDGKNQRAVSSVEIPATYPSWSPDGKRLIFSGSVDGEQFDLYVLVLESGDMRRILARADLSERHASWSPDGELIAFSSKTKDSLRSFDRSIFVMNADGSAVRQLTQSKYHDFTPSWRVAAAPTIR